MRFLLWLKSLTEPKSPASKDIRFRCGSYHVEKVGMWYLVCRGEGEETELFRQHATLAAARKTVNMLAWMEERTAKQ